MEGKISDESAGGSAIIGAQPRPPLPMPASSDSSRHPLAWVRLFSLLDGISFIVLTGVAMPLKYFADMPMAVRIAGSVHGFFFLALCAFLLQALLRKRLTFAWCCFVFLCAITPFAPFFLDHKLKKLGGTKA